MTLRRHHTLFSTIALFVTTGLILVVDSRFASGHGIPFEVGYDSILGKITVSPTIYDNFDPDEMFFPDGFGGAGNDQTPGWGGTLTLPSATRLSLRFLQPLQYWNPATGENDPLPTPGATLSILAAGHSLGESTEVTASGVTGVNPVFLASFTGTAHHHVVWEILDTDAQGLYGLWASLESTDPLAFDAAPSDPFLVVLNWGIADAGQYSTGVNRLAVSPVPEPGAVTLGIAAVVAGLACWRRRRKERSWR